MEKIVAITIIVCVFMASVTGSATALVISGTESVDSLKEKLTDEVNGIQSVGSAQLTQIQQDIHDITDG